MGHIWDIYGTSSSLVTVCQRFEQDYPFWIYRYNETKQFRPVKSLLYLRQLENLLLLRLVAGCLRKPVCNREWKRR